MSSSSSSPSLQYITPSEVVKLLRQHHTDPSNSDISIIDVRDEDFIGGNLPHAINIPSTTFHKHVDKVIDTIVSSNQRIIIFHCYKSQVRGPQCAKMFIEKLSQKYDQKVDKKILNEIQHPTTTATTSTATSSSRLNTETQRQTSKSDNVNNNNPNDDDTAMSISTTSGSSMPRVYVLRDGFEGYIRYIMTHKDITDPTQHVDNYLEEYWGYKM